MNGGVEVGPRARLFDSFVSRIQAALLSSIRFTTPEQQINKLLMFNHYWWNDPGIDQGAIDRLGRPPKCPKSNENAMYCVTLLAESGNPLYTWDRNWKACQMGSHQVRRAHQKLFSRVRVRPGAPRRPIGLRWAVIELGFGYKGFSAEESLEYMKDKPLIPVGQELPLIAAMHPDWAKKLDLGVLAPDLQIDFRGDGSFDQVPYLRADDSAVCLDAATISMKRITQRLVMGTACILNY